MHSDFKNQFFGISTNFPKTRHQKLSNALKYISVGQLVPNLEQFLSKIDFDKKMDFVKKKSMDT